MSLRNSFNQLDFDRPENNPKGIWPLRNRNFTHRGLTIDKVELYVMLYDMHDAVHTEMTVDADGHLLLKDGRISAVIRMNPDDMHNGGDAVIKQAHLEAVTRMQNAQKSFRTTKYYLPEGVTIRTGPFSDRPAQVHQEFIEATMDFGEVDEHDLPILHDQAWLKFTIAVNRPTDNTATVRSEEIKNLASRFGDLGM